MKYKDKSEALKFKNISANIKTLQDLSECITDFIEESNKEYILFIDEVDKTSNNQLLLNFLGILRSKYLLARIKKDYTFKSVILAGVHDIKNLKIKIREDEQIKYNSPWNIAVNFDIDMSFNKDEIKTMLDEYCAENNLMMDTHNLSENIHYYTDGYPFLVSRICQIIDEKLLEDEKRPWNKDDIQKSVKYLLREKNTLFDDLIKNIENNEELYSTIYGMVIDGNRISFNRANPIIDLGYTYGIFKEDDNILKLNNRIYEQYIYDYIISKIEIQNHNMSIYNFKNNFVENGNLNIEKVIDRFQQFMKEQYSSLDEGYMVVL